MNPKARPPEHAHGRPRCPHASFILMGAAFVWAAIFLSVTK